MKSNISASERINNLRRELARVETENARLQNYWEARERSIINFYTQQLITQPPPPLPSETMSSEDNVIATNHLQNLCTIATAPFPLVPQIPVDTTVQQFPVNMVIGEIVTEASETIVNTPHRPVGSVATSSGTTVENTILQQPPVCANTIARAALSTFVSTTPHGPPGGSVATSSRVSSEKTAFQQHNENIRENALVMTQPMNNTLSERVLTSAPGIPTRAVTVNRAAAFSTSPSNEKATTSTSVIVTLPRSSSVDCLFSRQSAGTTSMRRPYHQSSDDGETFISLNTSNSKRRRYVSGDQQHRIECNNKDRDQAGGSGVYSHRRNEERGNTTRGQDENSRGDHNDGRSTTRSTDYRSNTRDGNGRGRSGRGRSGRGRSGRHQNGQNQDRKIRGSDNRGRNYRGKNNYRGNRRGRAGNMHIIWNN